MNTQLQKVERETPASYPVTAVTLERDGDGCMKVFLCIYEKWVEVISDYSTYASHTVTSLGIHAAIHRLDEYGKPPL